jgi:hypothetical protein
MAAEDPFIAVAAETDYAYYTRYPDGIGTDAAQDLLCPRCGGGRIGILEELPGGISMMLGDLAICWTCKRRFRITENCWRRRVR